ncbi:MAG: LysR family transcriptional regulator [Rhodocyclaceae bacterium]
MHIHARALKYFDTIRRCGSIRGAARQLHVASSALNRQLLQLEDEIGFPLFERMADGLKLTAVGEVFSRHVISVLQEEQRLQHELDALRGIRRGELSVVSIEGVNADVLPTVLERMLTRHPLVRISVRTAGSQQAAQAVAQADADVAISFSIERDAALHQFALARFQMGAVVRPDHPLASLDAVSFAECARYPLIMASPELSIHAALRPIVAHHKKPLTILTETSSLELAKSIAARGIGVAFQTRVGLERDLREGRLAFVPLRTPDPVVCDLGIYVRAGRSLPPVLDAFIRLLTEELDSRSLLDRAPIEMPHTVAQS